MDDKVNKDLTDSLANDENLQEENNDLNKNSDTDNQKISAEKDELLDKLEDEIRNNTPADENKSLSDNEELSDEEKREMLINYLKESRIKFKNTVHDGNVTYNKFDNNYKKKRNKRNKLAKKSRQKNRK